MPKAGEKRSNGAVTFTVIAADAKYVYVKRSEETKKSLANREGAYRVSLAEFYSWTEAK